MMTLSLDDHRSAGAGLADLRIAVDRFPDHFTGLGIKRNHRRVCLMQDDLAVGIGQATVDRVTAHDRDRVGILLRLVTPLDRTVRVEIQRENRVGERSMDIHNAADHQRRALMAAQHAGGECPGDFQIADVAGVDLRQFTVTVIGVIAGGRDPIRRVFFHDQQFVVRGSRSRERRKGKGHAGCYEEFSHRFSSLSHSVDPTGWAPYRDPRPRGLEHRYPRHRIAFA